MSKAEKFMFDLAFDKEVDPSPEPETNDNAITEDQEPEIIVPSFSEEDVENARQQGYEAGKVEGLAATTEILTKQINETLLKIDDKLIAAFKKQDSFNLDICRAAHSLAIGICKKMLPSMAKQSSFGEVEKVIEEVFSNALEKAKITITVPVDIVEEVKVRLTNLAEEREFKGRIQVKADDTIAASDCKIDWVDGGTERNTDKMWNDIVSILNRNIGVEPTIWDDPNEKKSNLAEKATIFTKPEELTPSIESNSQVEVQQQKRNANNDKGEFNEEQPINKFQQKSIDD